MNELICMMLIAVATIVVGVIAYLISKAAPKISNYVKSFIIWNFK